MESIRVTVRNALALVVEGLVSKVDGAAGADLYYRIKHGQGRYCGGVRDDHGCTAEGTLLPPVQFTFYRSAEVYTLVAEAIEKALPPPPMV